MSETTVQAPAKVPEWLADMRFCHLGSSFDSQVALCGHVTRDATPHGLYYGAAICTDCGCPTCPRCAQLAALEDALDDAGTAE